MRFDGRQCRRPPTPSRRPRADGCPARPLLRWTRDADTSSACAQCGRSIGGRLAFQFRSRVGTICKCLSCAVRHVPLLKRSASVALVVGSLLIVVNQGDLLLAGLWSPALAWKIPLTYLVPFLVATYGALGQSRVP